jgi:2-isopropylmalate synthase
MYSQGISPGLDFSNLSQTVALVCRCNDTQLPVRVPYAGELVFSAFAGTHQDAIKKGLDAQAARWAEVDRSGQGTKYWAMPYVPLDPKDLGYGYENLIRVSSQSGKAGPAHIIKQTMHLDLPRRMQVSFYKVVQDQSEQTGKEMTAALITSAFKQVYCLDSKPIGRLFLHSFHLHPILPPSKEPGPLSSDLSEKYHNLSYKEEPLMHFEGDFSVDGQRRIIRGEGCGSILAILDAFRADLGLELNIGESAEQTIQENPTQSESVTFIELFLPGSSPAKSGTGSTWGVGISSDIVTSKCRAVISAANQLVDDVNLSPPLAVSSVSADGWLPWAKRRVVRFLSERFGWLMVETSP